MVKFRVFLAAFCLTLIGCGGGGSGVPGANVIVVWPDRTRETVAPKSANFAALAVYLDATNFVTGPKVARGTNTLTHLSKLQTPSGVPAGLHRVTVRFFANAADINPVAIADFPTYIDGDGNVFNPDKSHLGPINFTSRIASLTPSLPRSIFTSKSPTLSLVARDADGNVVAFDPVAMRVASQSGPGQVAFQKDSTLSTVSAGADTLTFSVDGVESTPIDVDCYNSVSVPIKPTWISNNNASDQLWVITASPDNRLLKLDPNTGATLNSVSLGMPCAFARVSADGTTAYAAATSSNTVLKIDTATNTITKTLTVTSPTGLVNPTIVDLAVQPSNHNNFIVTFQSGANVLGQATLYLNGVMAPSYQPTNGLVYPYWIDDATVLMGSTGATKAATFRVDGSGFGSVITISNIVTGPVMLYNGNIYTDSGYVMTYPGLGSFGKFRDDPPGKLLDLRPDLDRSLFTDPNMLPSTGFLSYTMFSAVPTVKRRFTVDALVQNPAGVNNVPATFVGTDGIALTDGRALYIVRGVTGS